ncbi:MAG: dTDP-4-dehydrorhamnose reductase [Bacteroidales bacterium]|nr:dTDP-4-dehydrorhamnose reductase [Bacteroidales bacterium]
MKILVTGSKGQLGQKIRDKAIDFTGFEFVFTDIEQVDITSESEIDSFFSANKPDILINCAAYTAVDRAEDDKENAFLVNSIAPQLLAAACKKYDSKFIHTSTDYVFDGSSTIPYTENDQVNPKSVYGLSKLGGEQKVQDILPDSIIIRTSWLYSEYGSNFVKTMIRLANEKEFLNVVNDQRGTPTYAGDLASAILVICNQYAASGIWKHGIYHYSNSGECTWFDFATEILKLKGIKTPVLPVSSDKFPSKVVRPKYSVLDKSKIINDYNIKIPNWEDSLRGAIDKF